MANDIAGSQLRVYVTPKPVILTATLCHAWSPSQRFGLIALWHDGPAVPTGKKPSRRDGRCEGPQNGHYRVTRQETCTSILRPDWVYYPAGEKRRQRCLPLRPGALPLGPATAGSRRRGSRRVLAAEALGTAAPPGGRSGARNPGLLQTLPGLCETSPHPEGVYMLLDAIYS